MKVRYQADWWSGIFKDGIFPVTHNFEGFDYGVYARSVAVDVSLQEHSCWTDDLPVCHLSGVGFSTNQIYREDGLRREEHEFEDRSFHFR